MKSTFISWERLLKSHRTRILLFEMLRDQVGVNIKPTEL